MLSLSRQQTRFALPCFAAVAALILLPSVGKAEVHSNGQVVCYGDRPCINTVYLDVNSIQLFWRGNESYDFYNVKWAKPGAEETKRMLKGGLSGSLALTQVTPQTQYTFQIQGCNTRLWGGPECTAWETQAVISGNAIAESAPALVLPANQRPGQAVPTGTAPGSMVIPAAQPIEAAPQPVAPMNTTPPTQPLP